jgi:predicted DNA-binding protein
MERFCKDNKQTIIDLAADRLAEKLSRTKVVKEATEKVLKEMESK